MNGRHLPAGQGGMPPDIGRRRPYNQNHIHSHSQHQGYPPGPQMYNPYANPYTPSYYPQQQLPPQYHNASSPHQQYNPYPYVRSPPPPPMQHFPHPPIPQQHQQSYPPPPPRPQQSPAIASSYQAPPPPQTPSSTQSAQTIPRSVTPQTPQPAPTTAPTSPVKETSSEPFRAPLPWFSRPDLQWPTRRSRRKRRPTHGLSAKAVELPEIQQGAAVESEQGLVTESLVPRPETPSTNHPHSEETASTTPTTPSSIQQASTPLPGETTPVATKPIKPQTVPAVPVIRTAPKISPTDSSRQIAEKVTGGSTGQQPATKLEEKENKHEESEIKTKEPEVSSPAPKAWTTPKLWTGLFNANSSTSVPVTNEHSASAGPGVSKSNAESLAEALRSFDAVSNDSKVAFLEPRGLVNTGNMCYMNSVLQVLVFCTPFFTFLSQVGKQTAHSFKSETPLIDAMIMFMREFTIIDSATSVEQLRMRLKEGELEQYGEAFTPDFVYDVIKRLPRFSSMRRGHQQDAEEFLGFLLEGLHDECVQVMQTSASNSTSAIATPVNGPSSPISDVASTAGSVTGKENGWLEVGPKQKAAITRSSGAIADSPITKIFGGKLRSELRVPGLKNSVTLEPYQPLQLDIGAPTVNNILDALKGLTRSEPLHGDFKSPKGPNVTATKQVFIETLPPVLILHLKRFQYDNAGGTQKIWKKVGYPLELEIPKEVFPRPKQGVFSIGGLPKYRLIAAVYHHGKNASGGHYTVDVRRQDGREWIRLDDTVIRRVRSEDVAEGGSEEDPKVLAAALEAHKKDSSVSGNMFATINDEEESTLDDGWKQASGSGKKWSNVVNGTSTPKAKMDKSSVKDNKVAYLLFYQRI